MCSVGGGSRWSSGGFGGGTSSLVEVVPFRNFPTRSTETQEKHKIH